MKMFKIYFSFFLFCFALHSKAQINLVTNPSFEDTIQCPSNINQMNLAVGWSPFRGTPDYLNACNMTSVGIPSNGFGFQYARTGNGYAGFLSFYKPGIDQREIIGTELKQPLDVGIKYFVSFYICLAKKHVISNKYCK